MNWRTMPPREPGLYWVKFNNGKTSVVELDDQKHVSLIGGVIYAPVTDLPKYGVHLQWGDRLIEPT